LSKDRRNSITIESTGDVDIYYSRIILTPYDDETSLFFDEIADNIDRVLF
jgi:hypothetical protein